MNKKPQDDKYFEPVRETRRSYNYVFGVIDTRWFYFTGVIQVFYNLRDNNHVATNLWFSQNTTKVNIYGKFSFVRHCRHILHECIRIVYEVFG